MEFTSGISELQIGKLALKKAIPVMVRQIHDEFEVETLEGVMRGKKGDYLITGVNGEMYPCDREIFEKSYDFIE